MEQSAISTQANLAALIIISIAAFISFIVVVIKLSYGKELNKSHRLARSFVIFWLGVSTGITTLCLILGEYHILSRAFWSFIPALMLLVRERSS